MTRTIRKFFRPATYAAAAVSVALAATAAWALPPLAENKYINDRLVAAQVGDIIRKTCPTIGARMLYALDQAFKLQGYAEDLGYSTSEIKAFIKNPEQKARVKGIAQAYMKANGVEEGNAESYCVLGRSEIENRTITGSLLYNK